MEKEIEQGDRGKTRLLVSNSIPNLQEIEYLNS